MTIGEQQQQVVVKPLGDQGPIDPIAWPPGELISLAVQDDDDGNYYFWRAQARQALLCKYGYLQPTELQLKQTSKEQRAVAIQAIDSAWNTMITTSTSTTPLDDLQQLVTCSQSNRRPLQWALMTCPPACQFRLHAHPNLELVYCLQGELHEVRLWGAPLPTEHLVPEEPGSNVLAVHPTPLWTERGWKFGTLAEGQWLVNEVGSIHKSFTATQGRGCTLLVLWGGSHANLRSSQEPTVVTNAVAVMEERLLCACETGNGWERIDETFLPPSERRQEP